MLLRYRQISLFNNNKQYIVIRAYSNVPIINFEGLYKESLEKTSKDSGIQKKVKKVVILIPNCLVASPDIIGEAILQDITFFVENNLESLTSNEISHLKIIPIVVSYHLTFQEYRMVRRPTRIIPNSIYKEYYDALGKVEIKLNECLTNIADLSALANDFDTQLNIDNLSSSLSRDIKSIISKITNRKERTFNYYSNPFFNYIFPGNNLAFINKCISTFLQTLIPSTIICKVNSTICKNITNLKELDSIDKSSVVSITLPVIHGSQNRITLDDVAVGLRNNLLLKGAFHTYKTKDNESNEELEDEQADY